MRYLFAIALIQAIPDDLGELSLIARYIAPAALTNWPELLDHSSSQLLRNYPARQKSSDVTLMSCFRIILANAGKHFVEFDAELRLALAP